MRTLFWPIIVALLGLCLASCQRAADEPAAKADHQREPEKLAARHLPNAFRIHEKVISGGQPAGEAGFKELKALGVKTIVSVDGAKPEVELAKKHGLKYVHLPHGYDGISHQRATELAKAVRDLDGPIYFHCHHGHHRSPAAAAVACVAAGMIEPSSAVGILKAAGTSENYRGLYQSAESARKLDDALLDALDAELPEVAKLPPLAEAMVAIEQTHDHLQALAAAGWKTPPADPDLDPPHEALLLKEHFTELLRDEHVQDQPEKFRNLIAVSETAAEELEWALRDGIKSREAANALRRISQNCTNCHRQYRDVPLSEK